MTNEKQTQIESAEETQETPKSGAKKVIDLVGRVFSWIIIAFAVFMMIFTIISVTTVNKEDRSLFGFKPFIVLSNSMSPDYFDAGDLLFSKKVNTDTEQPPWSLA